MIFLRDGKVTTRYHSIRRLVSPLVFSTKGSTKSLCKIYAKTDVTTQLAVPALVLDYVSLCVDLHTYELVIRKA